MMLLNSLQKSHEFYQFFQINHAKETFYVYLVLLSTFFVVSMFFFSHFSHIFFLKMQRYFI